MTRLKLDFGQNVSDVLYVAELAAKLGMTESAVRAAAFRDRLKTKTEERTLPTPFYMGQKLAWRRRDVDLWLEQRAKGGNA